MRHRGVAVTHRAAVTRRSATPRRAATTAERGSGGNAQRKDPCLSCQVGSGSACARCICGCVHACAGLRGSSGARVVLGARMVVGLMEEGEEVMPGVQEAGCPPCMATSTG